MQRLYYKAANILRLLCCQTRFVRWIFTTRSKYIANSYCEHCNSQNIHSVFAKYSQKHSFSVGELANPLPKCSNVSAPLNKMAARAINKRKSFKGLLLLNQWTDFELISQEGSLGNSLLKLLKLSRAIQQDGHQS